MSTTSKAVLGSSCVISAAIIVYVHYKQIADRESMHKGVLRDMEQQEMRRRANLQELANQAALTKFLKEQDQDQSK